MRKNTKCALSGRQFRLLLKYLKPQIKIVSRFEDDKNPIRAGVEGVETKKNYKIYKSRGVNSLKRGT